MRHVWDWWRGVTVRRLREWWCGRTGGHDPAWSLRQITCGRCGHVITFKDLPEGGCD